MKSYFAEAQAEIMHVGVDADRRPSGSVQGRQGSSVIVADAPTRRPPGARVRHPEAEAAAVHIEHGGVTAIALGDLASQGYRARRSPSNGLTKM